jgi:hypothetical protein
LAHLLLLCLSAAAAQTPQIPKMADGKPNFSGYGNLPYFPNMAQNKEAEVPYTPLELAAFKNHDAKDDPTSLCLYPGVPRIMSSPYPMQIVQTRNYVAMLFDPEPGSTRPVTRIATNRT